jgi:hypothetical protein
MDFVKFVFHFQIRNGYNPKGKFGEKIQMWIHNTLTSDPSINHKCKVQLQTPVIINGVAYFDCRLLEKENCKKD